ncbi:MAG: histone-like protein [Halobacteriaceae archaeon]
MTIELPVAPVDQIIRRHADDLRVSADAAAALARRIQRRGAQLAVDAAAEATSDGRKTIQACDFGATNPPPKADLTLPIAPVDRIARRDIDDRYQIASDARLALAADLETYASDVADVAATLARHADRRTVQAEDVALYDELFDATTAD